MSSEAANSSKDYYGDPPQLLYDVPSSSGIQTTGKEPNLPVDILLLTVENDEFLACYQQLKNPCRWWFDDLGYVYFEEEDESQKEKVKIVLLKCYGGSGGPGGSLISVKNAVTVLRPKAVISVGACSALNPAKTKLGDVIVSSRLSTYASKVVMSHQEQSTGLRTYVTKHFLNVIKNCADGWQAPLKNREASKAVEVHCGEILSGPEQIQAEYRRDQLAKCNLMAMAVEMEGEGVFTAAFDSGIEWLIVKGIADCTVSCSAQQNAKSWRRCACVMAASLVMHILSNPTVFRSWPHSKERVAGIKRSAQCEKVEGSVKSLKSDVADVQLPLTQVEEKQSSAEPPIIPEFADCESDIRFFAARCHENTRQWLFEDFEKWFTDPGDSRAYVLLGDAGVGKSVIAAALAQSKREAGHLAAAYFCRHKDRRRNHPLSLLGTLARDLCRCSSEYSSIVGGEEGVKKLITNSEFKLQVRELFAKLLEEPLAKCRSPPNRRLVIIDALDETEYGSRKDFLNVIKLYFPRLPQWLLFFITSRPEEQIQNRLNRYKPCIKMCAGITDRDNFYHQHKKDIQRYLEKEIDFSVFSFSPEDVTKKCGGLFLYAFYIVKELKDSAKSGKVTQLAQLTDFPGDIDEFFLQNFERVFDKVGRDIYRILLGCIMAAPSQLPVSFIAFVLKRENSSLEEYDIIDAVSQFVVLTTSDRTMTFLHSLIKVWLSDKTKAQRLFVDKASAGEYLKTSFIEILSAVVDVPSSTLSSVSINDDLQNYVLRVAIRFLCQYGDKNCLENVYKILTCYIYLQKRIEICDPGLMEMHNLRVDLLLAAGCFTGKETFRQNILKAIEGVLSDDVSLQKCQNLLLFCIRNVSGLVRESVWSTPHLLKETFSDCVGKKFALSSDNKKVVGILGNQSLFLADTTTLEIARGPFGISEGIIEGIYYVEFSPDERFIFFGRLDKWFSLEQECVVDLAVFSGNSLIYQEGYLLEDGPSKYFCVVAYDIPGFDYFPCQQKGCIVDLLAMWALLEIDDDIVGTTCTYTQLSDAISKTNIPLGKPTTDLLEFLGVDLKLFKANECPNSYEPSCSCCRRLTELTESGKEPATLTVVHQCVLEFYPYLFESQVWDFYTGKSFLYNFWNEDCEMSMLGVCYDAHRPSSLEEWNEFCGCLVGRNKRESVCNIAVDNAVFVLKKLCDREGKILSRVNST